MKELLATLGRGGAEGRDARGNRAEKIFVDQLYSTRLARTFIWHGEKGLLP